MKAMQRRLPRLFIFWLLVTCFASALSLRAAPQQPGDSSAAPDRATAYYHYALAHLYEQLAVEHMNREYLKRSVDEYQKAIEADPSADILHQGLMQLYARSNRLDDAVAEADKVLERDPDNVEILSLMGQIYSRYAFGRRGEVNQEILNSAIEKFERVHEIDSSDKESLLQLSNLYRAAKEKKKAEQALKDLLELEPDSSEALASLAFLYLDSGDTQGAIEALEKVQAAGDANRNQLTALATAYEQAGEFRKAAEIFEKLIGRGDNPLAASRGLAHNLVLSGQYDKALEQYELLVDADPRNPENHLRMSQIYREKRMYSEARDSLLKARELAPDSLEIKYNLVQLLEAEGKTADATKAMLALLDATAKDDYSPQEKQNRAMFLEQLGILYRAGEDFAKADNAFKEMGEIDSPAKPRSLAHRIDGHRYAKEHEKARALAKQARKEFPDNRPLAILYSTVLAESGETEKGAKILKSLLDGSRRDHQVYLSLVQIHEKGKRFDEAVKIADKALENSKSERQRLTALFSYASVLERAKRYEESEEKFRELLALDPTNASALNYLGYMLADRNERLDDAHDYVQKALDLDPDNGAYLDSLGWVYYRQEKLELAERYLRRSLEHYKHDPTVLSHLGDVYFKLGKPSEAKAHWERSLEEWQKSARSDRDPVEIAKLRKKLSDLQMELSSNTSNKKKKQ